MSGVSNTWSSHWGTNDPTTDAVKQHWHVGATRWNEDSTSAIICWQCTASGYPGTWIARYAGYGGDSIPRVANVAALTAIDTSAYLSSQMHLAEVVTLGDSFRYIPSGGRGTYSAATAYAVDDFVVYLGLSYRCRAASTGNTPPVPPAAATTFWEVRYDIVACATGTGTWSRMLVGDKAFFKAAILSATAKTPEGIYVNAATGNDENTGLSSGSPLSSFAEMIRRLTGVADGGTINVYVTGRTPQTLNLSTIKSTIRIIGTPTVLTSTTLNGAADLVTGVSPTVGYVTSASLDFHSGGLVSTTTRSTFIRRDNGDGSFTYAAIQRTDSGTPLRAKITKQCKFTPGNAAGWAFEHEPVSNFLASGQSVDVVQFPLIGSIIAAAGTTVRCYLLDAGSASGNVSFQMCGFTGGFANSTKDGSVQLLGGIIQCSGATISANGSISQLLSVGVGTSAGSAGSLNVRFCDLQNMLYLTVDNAALSLADCNVRFTACVFSNVVGYAIVATQTTIYFDSPGFCCASTVDKILLCDRGTRCTGFELGAIPNCSPSSSTPITILGMAHGDLSLNQIPAWSTYGNSGVA